MDQAESSIEDKDKFTKEVSQLDCEDKMEEDAADIGSEHYYSVDEDFISSGDEMDNISELSDNKSDEKSYEISSGYASSSDEEKMRTTNDNTLKLVEPNYEEKKKDLMRQIAEKYNVQNLSDDLHVMLIEGFTEGLPNDYNVPIDKKPDWLDMEKFKRGQAFARKYFCGVNISEMASLFILFGLPDGLETLIFSDNSSSPFTSFQRYLSTVIRIASWYDYDIWSKGNPGYQNIRTVRGMHLNISKRMGETPYDELKNKVTLSGSPEKPAIWNTSMRDTIREDVSSGCPFQVAQSNYKHIRRDVFVTQMEMSVTQFGFVGLMVTFPEKFGAGGASREDLDAFLHTWRGICYLLGVQDKYNFCNGNLDDVVKRCQSLIENLIKPSFHNLTEDWEHMSRCLVEGMGYVASKDKYFLSFEVSMMHLLWILDIPAPRLYSTLTWKQRFEFFMMKFMLTQAVKVPGVLPFINWFMRRTIRKAAALPSDELEKLKNRKYEYQEVEKAEKRDKIYSTTFSRGSALLLLSLARILV